MVMDLYLSKLIPLFIYPFGIALVLSMLVKGILGISPRLARLLLFLALTVTVRSNLNYYR